MSETGVHEVTVVESGSWQRTITGSSGSYEYGDLEKVQTELFIKAECTCGRSFTTLEAVYDHLAEVTDR